MTESPGPPLSVAAPPIEPRRRLDPLTPLLRGGRLAVLVIAGISWQGYQNLGTQRWLYAIGLVGVLVLITSLVSWYVTGYHVIGRELRIYEGLLWRRTRAIPLERLQSVELVQPLLARLGGVAELKLEVVGAEKTEAPLAFLRLAEATALRERLLGLARQGPTATEQPDGDRAVGDARIVDSQPMPAPVRPEQVVHVVTHRDLIVSQLLRPQWWFLPFAIAAPVLYFTQQNDLGFIAVASTVTAIIGAIQAPIRVVLGDWRFTIATAVDGLRLRRGLVETRSQTVPPGRIQSITIQWPLLWRGHGWVRASIDVAGVATSGGDGAQAGTLLPVSTVPVAQAVIGEVLPGFHLTSVIVHPVPSRARWITPLRRRVLGYQLTGTAFVTRDGLFTRRLIVVPYGRIQSVRVRQGPLQRLLRLASVWVDSAGRGAQAVAPHRDAAEAQTLATQLAGLALAASSESTIEGQRP